LLWSALGLWVALVWRLRELPALGTDSLIYHLSLPAAWVQNGLLSPVDVPFHGSIPPHGPLSAELLLYVLMRLTGDDGLAWIVQPAFLAATLRFFFVSARLLGAGRTGATLLTAALALFPPFLSNMQVADNDLVMTCGAAAFIYGTLLTRLRPGRGLAWAGGGIGLMLAAKHVGVIYAPAALAVAAGAAAARWRGSAGRTRRAIAWGAIGGTAMVLLGSGFFLRTWVAHGNPFYPSEVRILGRTIFAGLFEASGLVTERWSLDQARDLFIDHSHLYAMKLPFGAVLVPAFFAAPLAWALRRLRRGDGIKLAVGTIFPAAGALSYLALRPIEHVHRYVFPVYYGMWIAAALAAALLARTRARGWLEPGLAVAVAGLLLLYGVASSAGIVGTAVLGAAIAALAGGMLGGRRVVRVGVTAVASALLVWVGSSAAREARQAARAAAYEQHYGSEGRAWAAVDREPARVVAYAGVSMIFPLFGPRLERRVVYVPISPEDRPRRASMEPDPTREPSPVIFLRMAQARRRAIDETFWLEGLRRERVELLLLSDKREFGGTAPERSVVARRPDRFERVFEEGGFTLYRVRP
jgi:hypothetical protein